MKTINNGLWLGAVTMETQALNILMVHTVDSDNKRTDMIIIEPHFLLWPWKHLISKSNSLWMLKWNVASALHPFFLNASLNLNMFFIPPPWLELTLFLIYWKSGGSFSPVMCVLSLSPLPLSLSDFVLFLGECSIPTHVPHTVTVHTAVARVPSPTLVCSTVPPYRYMAQLWMLQSTHSV